MGNLVFHFKLHDGIPMAAKQNDCFSAQKYSFNYFQSGNELMVVTANWPLKMRDSESSVPKLFYFHELAQIGSSTTWNQLFSFKFTTYSGILEELLSERIKYHLNLFY